MSDDFKVGDVAICVNAKSREGFAPCTLKERAMYKILEIGRGSINGEPCAVVSGFDIWSPLWRFRKLPPAEPEFISLIRSLGVPKRVREDA